MDAGSNRCLLVLALAAWITVPAGLAQDSPPVLDEEPEVTFSDRATASGDPDLQAELEDEEADLENIDDILAQDEEVLYSDQGGTYDPGARRDPFRSLLQPAGGEVEIGERPEGIAGLLIDEIEIQGVFVTEDGPVAQVMAASDETSYLLRPGDQLWDGDVVRVSLQEVVFKQTINDPTALKPFREVVKKLNL